MSDQIGIAGTAKYYGIPQIVITFKGRSGTNHTCTLFGKVDKETAADIDPSNDLKGERQGQNRRNKTIPMSFTAVPVGTKSADAFTIAKDLPIKGDPITIVADGSTVGGVVTEIDTDLHSGTDSVLIESARTSYTPEGYAAIDFSVTRWIGKAFVPLADS